MPTKAQSQRRNFLKRSASAAAAAALGPLIFVPRYAQAKSSTLRILQWNHFVPSFDDWFNNVYTKEWGEAHDCEVQIDNVGMTSLHGRAKAEIAAQDGHDLVMFLRPSPTYEDQVIDHKEIYEECEHKYGKPIDLAVKSTYNPRTRKYFGFSDSYVPDPVNYRKDLWDDVGVFPKSWEDHVNTWNRHERYEDHAINKSFFTKLLFCQC